MRHIATAVALLALALAAVYVAGTLLKHPQNGETLKLEGPKQ